MKRKNTSSYVYNNNNFPTGQISLILDQNHPLFFFLNIIEFPNADLFFFLFFFLVDKTLVRVVFFSTCLFEMHNIYVFPMVVLMASKYSVLNYVSTLGEKNLYIYI